MNEIVKYDNYINKLCFKGFKAVEYNLFMTLCSKLKNKDTNIVILSFKELKEISEDTKHTNEEFILSLKSMNKKLMKITCDIETDNESIMFVLFTVFKTDYVKQTLTVCVNEYFKFILNDITKNFTRFDLAEFVKLDSKYAKILYRLLKQFRSTGKYETSVTEFREKMDCPVSYNNKQFMQSVINRAVKELKEKECFSNLECIVQYAKKKGKPVAGYTFTFDAEESVKQNQDRKQSSSNKKRNEIKNNRFNNIENRNYNYDELEKQLLTINEQI